MTSGSYGPGYAGERFSLDGRVAVVTGAGAGLGREFSLVLASAGAAVVALDIDGEAAESTMALVRDIGGRGLAIEADVSRRSAVNEAAGRINRDLGGADVLVNNAGISTPSRRVHEIPVEEWDEVLRVNLRSTFLMTRGILPLMLDAEGGSIINISSVVGTHALDPALISQADYAASKAGVIGLTLQTAADYGEFGIRANAVAPGWHLGTDLGKRVGNFPTQDEQRELQRVLASRTPLGRTGRPAELGPLILYLASDASSFVTGAVFTHDGGWTAW